MFTYTKYRNDNLTDLKLQFDVFSKLFMKAGSGLKLFCMVVLSVVWPLYTHIFQSNEFALNFYLKSAKFLFLFSIQDDFLTFSLYKPM